MATTETLEQKAERLYAFIYEYFKENAKAPSHREMYEHIKCSPNTLGELLNLLEQSGKGLHRVKGGWRRIWVPVHDEPAERG